MADIFISYARPDRARIEKLAAALETAGYSVWWDTNLTGGAQFSKELAKQLNQSRAVVVAWSKTSIESMWVADEATVGRNKKNLVPITIDAVEPPLGFRQLHEIDFVGWGGDVGEAPFIQLDKSIANLLERAPSEIEPKRPTLVNRILRAARATPGRIAAFMMAVIASIMIATFSFTKIGERGGVPSENVIAVLSFTNASGSQANDYLSEGLADELRDQLGRVPGLRVKARASSIAVQAETLDAQEIGRRLGARSLVEGSVLRQGSQLHVSVRIIDAFSGDQIWSQRYERTAKDLLGIQQDIASAVVNEIAEGKLEPSSVTTNITAYDKLLLARHYEQQVMDAQIVDETKLARAIDLYRAAVDADPQSAIARARLARALTLAGDHESAQPEIYQAISLDPNQSEVQYTLALYYLARGDDSYETAIERAVALGPNNADALQAYGFVKWVRFSPDEPEIFFRRALDADPLSLKRYVDIGHFYGYAGYHEKALAIAKEIELRFATVDGFSTAASIYNLVGEFELAISMVTKGLALSPQNEDLKGQIAEFYAEIGAFEKAATFEPQLGVGQLYWRRDYERLIDLAEELMIEDPDQGQLWYLLAFAYSATGKHENAVRLLRLAGQPRKISAAIVAGGSEIQALATFAVSAQAVGAVEEARHAAQLLRDFQLGLIVSGNMQGWWTHTFLSCAYAVLGEDEKAMEAFTKVNDSPGHARLPQLLDYGCFERFKHDARYLATIARTKERQTEERTKVGVFDIPEE